jgi:hypothetical protein
MNKQDLINQINSEELEATLKDTLIEKVNSYPDQLSNENLMEFDALLADLQSEEVQSAALLTDTARNIDSMIDELDAIEDQYVHDSTTIKRDGPKTLQGLVGQE